MTKHVCITLAIGSMTNRSSQVSRPWRVRAHVQHAKLATQAHTAKRRMSKSVACKRCRVRTALQAERKKVGVVAWGLLALKASL